MRRLKIGQNFQGTDVFSMSSCTETSKLVHHGGYMQKLSQLFTSPEILLFERQYLVTKVLLNADRFYIILATIQYFKFHSSNFGNPPLWTSM